MTKFALGHILIKSHPFWFDGNGKITRKGGSFDHPLANAFSLVQIQDCPFSTPICQTSCYVHRLEQSVPEIHSKYQENSKNIKIALSCFFDIAVSAFAEWIKTNASQGFRWHVSGDIFSETYAKFIRDVCLEAPLVPFWLYTRSFNFLESISEVSNLIVNLSADIDNFAEAVLAQTKYNFRICYMTVAGEIPASLPKGSVIFPSHELRGRGLLLPVEAPWWQSLSLQQQKMVCTPDFFGQSEKMRCGPCKKCLT